MTQATPNDRSTNPVRVSDERAQGAIDELIRLVGGDPDTFDGRLIAEMIDTSLKLIPDSHDTGQLKLIARSLKEMRYAYRVFNQYPDARKISIFGSARTPEDHPDYLAAKTFAASIVRKGWMTITGAGDGIMKAGHDGLQRETIFGLSIRLPFETTANTVIKGDPKLINFRYFFTRKLMFMSHSDAVAVFPGGFGTQDELFEALTLVQTGKSNIIPIVLVDGEGGVYWEHWQNYIEKNLKANGWISDIDTRLFHRAATVQDAVEHVQRFYHVYHSSRYVGEKLVMRLNSPLREADIERLSDEFQPLLASGKIEAGSALDGEEDHRHLPRIVLHHNRRMYGLVRCLIDRINELGSA